MSHSYRCPNTIKRLTLRHIAVPVLLLLSATPAMAGNRQAQEKAARKACLSGDYTQGVSILADLFVETREPIYVFNQGRCFEQNLRYQEAIGRFEEYLRVGETATLDAADRAAAEKHIADCKGRLPKEPEKIATVPLPTPQPVPQPGEAATQLTEKPTPAKRRTGLLTAGVITGVVGLAAVGAGIAFNLKANSMVDEMETKLDGYTTSKNDSRSTYATMTWVGYGVGAACIATGAVLVGLGIASRRASSGPVALVPAVAPGQAGVLLHGGF
jgi:hypothetical protein